MSVSNLAYPQWHPVSCNNSIKVDVICVLRFHVVHSNPFRHAEKFFKEKRHSCPNNYILFQKQCFHFSREKITDAFKIEDLNETENHFKNTLLRCISGVNYARILFAFPLPSSSFKETSYEYDSLTKPLTNIKQGLKLKYSQHCIAQKYRQILSFLYWKMIQFRHTGAIVENISQIKWCMMVR